MGLVNLDTFFVPPCVFSLSLFEGGAPRIGEERADPEYHPPHHARVLAEQRRGIRSYWADVSKRALKRDHSSLWEPHKRYHN